MEYLKPIEDLRSSLTLYKKLTIGLAILLSLAIVGVPFALRSGPYVVTEQGDLSQLAQSRPWEISVARIEGFTKQFLKSRFEWDAKHFDQQRGQLELLTTDVVFGKLKDSINSFRSLAQNQAARCYYLLEGFGFSNSQQKIEARIVRVIRIGAIATATPLTIRVSYRDAKLTRENPYGLAVSSLEEVLPQETEKEEAKR